MLFELSPHLKIKDIIKNNIFVFKYPLNSISMYAIVKLVNKSQTMIDGEMVIRQIIQSRMEVSIIKIGTPLITVNVRPCYNMSLNYFNESIMISVQNWYNYTLSSLSAFQAKYPYYYSVRSGSILISLFFFIIEMFINFYVSLKSGILILTLYELMN